MAQKVRIELIDDLDGSEAVETISFGLDGQAYEIDLSTTNGESLRKGLEEYIKAGRKVSKSGRIKAPAAHAQAQSKVTPIGPSNREIRDWARSNGHEVPDRGRIPGEIRAAFKAAQGS